MCSCQLMHALYRGRLTSASDGCEQQVDNAHRCTREYLRETGGVSRRSGLTETPTLLSGFPLRFVVRTRVCSMRSQSSINLVEADRWRLVVVCSLPPCSGLRK